MSRPKFDQLPLVPELQTVVKELGYEAMTPIQAQSIPLLLEGRDLVGQSKTGSGKTAAFSLPILNRLAPLDLQEDRTTRALILCPTRELCTQVAREVRKLGRRNQGLQVLVLSGGLPLRPQINALRKGVHIVVGTPGRVLDHLRRFTLRLDQTKTVVLDEADRMLDMGFQEDMEEILASLPKERQTVFFSATYPDTIDEMSHQYQKAPTRVTIEDQDGLSPTISQNLIELDADEKFDALLWILRKYKPQAAIIFCNLKETVKELAAELEKEGVSSACIHGDLEQPDRDRVMAKFRNRSVRVLVATDVAARGIDIADLDLVVNFDLHSKPEIYVHRIGRTGRAGKSGVAVSFATKRELFKVEEIEYLIGMTIPRLEPDETAGAPAEELQQAAEMETLYISGGRKEKMRPGDILGALTGEAGGLDGKDVGKIEIHDHFSYVAVSKRVAKIALERLRNGRIKGRKFRVEPVR